MKGYPFQFQGNELWNKAHDGSLPSGKYKVTIEVRGRNVLPIRKDFVFWGDKTGPHCLDADHPVAQSTQPLEFEPTEMGILSRIRHSTEGATLCAMANT